MSSCCRQSSHGLNATWNRDDFDAMQVEHDWTCYGATLPLMSTVKSGHVDIVALLLERGADVGRKNKDGWSLLL
jgi:hypothetical protein